MTELEDCEAALNSVCLTAERLQVENSRLRALQRDWQNVGRLREENERLRAALARIGANGSDARAPPLDRYAGAGAMSNDSLIERLRTGVYDEKELHHRTLHREAADEIERLRAALERIIELHYAPASGIAREALK
jgi:hypothetical protein